MCIFVVIPHDVRVVFAYSHFPCFFFSTFFCICYVYFVRSFRTKTFPIVDDENTMLDSIFKTRGRVVHYRDLRIISYAQWKHRVIFTLCERFSQVPERIYNIMYDVTWMSTYNI